MKLLLAIMRAVLSAQATAQGSYFVVRVQQRELKAQEAYWERYRREERR